MVNVIWSILLIAGGAYSALCLYLFLAQASLIFFPNTPSRELTASPADIDLEFESVSIKTADQVTLHGWFIPAPEEKGTLLFFHGNAGNISHRLDSIAQFQDLGLSVLIIDYRGYGKSEGRTTEKGIYRDADAAWRYLIESRGVAASDIVIFGRSLGASVASRLAIQHQPLALILESSFTSVPDIAQDIYPWLPVRWLSRLRHAARDYVRDVRCPVLVIHSRDDEIIPFHHSETIFASANEPRTLLAIRGTHNDAFLRDERNYIEGLRAFLSGLSAPALSR